MDASGVIFQMLDEMSYLLNFTYNVREPEDGSWDSMIQKVSIIFSCPTKRRECLITSLTFNMKVANKEVMLGAAAFAINDKGTGINVIEGVVLEFSACVCTSRKFEIVLIPFVRLEL